MSQSQNYKRSNTSTETYEPFMLGDKQAGEVHGLSVTNSSDQPTYSGLWRCEPMVFDYEFPGDEYIYALEGSLLVEAENEKYEINKGDIVLFKKGIKSVWTVKTSFKKFFVIDNC